MILISHLSSKREYRTVHDNTIDNFCGVKCSNTRVYCDTSSGGGGGWTVIQRRQDGSVEFEQRD